MASKKRKRRPHRSEVTHRRQRQQAAARTQATVDAAGRAEEMRRAFRRHRRNQIAGWVSLAAGLVIGLVHFVDHLNLIHLFSKSLEEAVIGWPTAGILVVVGVIFLGQLALGEQRRGMR